MVVFDTEALLNENKRYIIQIFEKSFASLLFISSSPLSHAPYPLYARMPHAP